MVNKNKDKDKNNSGHSLVLGRWPQTKIMKITESAAMKNEDIKN